MNMMSMARLTVLPCGKHKQSQVTHSRHGCIVSIIQLSVEFVDDLLRSAIYGSLVCLQYCSVFLPLSNEREHPHIT